MSLHDVLGNVFCLSYPQAGSGEIWITHSGVESVVSRYVRSESIMRPIDWPKQSNLVTNLLRFDCRICLIFLLLQEEVNNALASAFNSEKYPLIASERKVIIY